MKARANRTLSLEIVALNLFFHCFAVTSLLKLAMLYVTHNARYGRIMGQQAIHPGKHLAEQLQELELSAAELARQLQVPTNRITEIMNEQRAITGDTALRLGHFFGTSADFWLNLQKLYRTARSRGESRRGDKGTADTRRHGKETR